MSIEKRRTVIVHTVIKELFADGRSAIRPGDVAAVLRDRNMPMGSWEIRAEFAHLERDAMLVCDAETGLWHLTENSTLKETG